jgi:hypothetical protein
MDADVTPVVSAVPATVIVDPASFVYAVTVTDATALATVTAYDVTADAKDGDNDCSDSAVLLNTSA